MRMGLVALSQSASSLKSTGLFLGVTYFDVSLAAVLTPGAGFPTVDHCQQRAYFQSNGKYQKWSSEWNAIRQLNS